MRRERISSNVFFVTIPSAKKKSWEYWVLLSSDRHWDNPKSNWKLQKKHLDEVKERDGLIIDCGDFFCAMQGRYDKRGNKEALRPEHRVDNYFDALVESASDWFLPYADRFLVIGTGNHETAIKKNHEIDLTERLVTLLNSKSKGRASVFNGHYTGWVKFMFRDSCYRNSILLRYDHGYGGGGAVTKDMIQHNRRSTYLPDPDIVVSGHTHDRWEAESARLRLSQKGFEYHDVQTHIKIPSYKEAYGAGLGGFEVERGFPPKPIGAWWLRFYFSRDHDKVIFDVIAAK